MMRRLVFAVSTATLALASPAAAEPVDVTAQAKAANATFLRDASPPGQPAGICLVDTGVNETFDTTGVVARLALDGDTRDRSPSLHGTEIAAFIGAARNGYGTIGLWPRARIVSVRANVTGQDAFTPARYVEGLRMCAGAAAAFGIKVIVLPLSSELAPTDGESAEFGDVVAAARAAGMNVVAAAGNSAGGPVGAPANTPGVLSVGAVNSALGGACAFSASGAQLLAPGCGLDGADPLTGVPTASRQGTDVAAALVATALAALRSWRPDLSADAAERILSTSARVTDAGPALDVAAAFSAAGLDSMAHAVPPLTAPTNITGAAPDAGTVTSGARLILDGGATRRLQSAQAVRFTGRLLSPGGAPIAHATVTVQTRNLFPKSQIARGLWIPLAHMVTDANGRFHGRLPKGPSRSVLVSYGTAIAQLHVVVPAQITLRATNTRIRNGARMTIRGRVTGPVPDGGAPVALEVRDGPAWIPVATTRRWVKTSDSGTFTLTYRFLRTFQPATYRFRVVADEDSDFPYVRGTSRTIYVHVRP